MSAKRDEIVGFCQEYLKTEAFPDHCHNGLQVAGSPEVKRIITGVSYSARLVEAAIKKGAQMILVHHGLFGNAFGDRISITGFQRDRLALLFKHDISLCGYHLPLDAHPEIGNNISLCRLLGVKKPEKLDVGFIGNLKTPKTLKQLTDDVNKTLATKSRVVAGGPQKIRRLAIVSGGASGYYQTAAKAGAEAFLCGDLREDVVRAAEELKMHVIDGGHYNTEKLGIQKLGELVGKKFRLPVEFVDIPCEI